MNSRNELFPFYDQGNKKTVSLLNEEEMKTLIIQHRPGVISAIENNRFHAVCDEIRQFASMSLLYNKDGLSLLENVNPLEEEFSASQFYYYFATGELAVDAVGAAAYLSALYKVFGFYSGWYRVGIPGNLEHGLTIVIVPISDVTVEINVHDPILQCTYRSRQQNSRDIQHVINGMIVGGVNEIIPDYQNFYPLKKMIKPSSNSTIFSYMSGQNVEVSDYELNILAPAAGEIFKEFLSQLPRITGRPKELCGIQDYIRFALTRPQMGDEASNNQIGHLFVQMGNLIQPRFNPGAMKFDIAGSKPHDPTREAPIPDGEGWKKLDNGYYVKKEAYPDEAGWVEIEEAHKATRIEHGISEDAIEVSELESYALAYALKQYAGKTVHMIELGSGFGKGCLEATSLVKLGKITPCPDDIRVAAIEAEPNHYKWTRETFAAQGMGDKAYFGAVSGRDGMVKFLLSDSSQNHYGQSIKPHGNFTVPAYSLETLFKKTGFPNIDILHLDIQGAETDVLRNSYSLFAEGLVDYIVLGTHGKEIEKELRAILAPTHELLIAVDSKEEVFFPSLNASYAATVDGFQFYRKWGL